MQKEVGMRNDICKSQDLTEEKWGELLSKYRILLLGEIERAFAPVTGQTRACLLETTAGIYSGHNYETIAPVHFDHAEDMAFRNLRSAGEVQILRVINAGKGLKKIKQVSPCRQCYDLLSPYFSPTTDFILFEPNTLQDAMQFTYEEHADAYGSKPFSAIQGTDLKSIRQELREKTMLIGRDLDFISELRRLGMAQGIQFYLTGSASGRGWMSNIIHQKYGTSYEDLDLVAVSAMVKEKVEKAFDDLFEKFYGTFEKRLHTINMWFIGEYEKRHNLHYAVNNKDIVNLCIAPTLKEGMIRMDYLQNNFFHQIS